MLDYVVLIPDTYEPFIELPLFRIITSLVSEHPAILKPREHPCELFTPFCLLTDIWSLLQTHSDTMTKAGSTAKNRFTV